MVIICRAISTIRGGQWRLRRRALANGRSPYFRGRSISRGSFAARESVKPRCVLVCLFERSCDRCRDRGRWGHHPPVGRMSDSYVLEKSIIPSTWMIHPVGGQNTIHTSRGMIDAERLAHRSRTCRDDPPICAGRPISDSWQLPTDSRHVTVSRTRIMPFGRAGLHRHLHTSVQPRKAVGPDAFLKRLQLLAALPGADSSPSALGCPGAGGAVARRKAWKGSMRECMTFPV